MVAGPLVIHTSGGWDETLESWLFKCDAAHATKSTEFTLHAINGMPYYAINRMPYWPDPRWHSYLCSPLAQNTSGGRGRNFVHGTSGGRGTKVRKWGLLSELYHVRQLPTPIIGPLGHAAVTFVKFCPFRGGGLIYLETVKPLKYPKPYIYSIYWVYGGIFWGDH